MAGSTTEPFADSWVPPRSTAYMRRARIADHADEIKRLLSYYNSGSIAGDTLKTTLFVEFGIDPGLVPLERPLAYPDLLSCVDRHLYARATRHPRRAPSQNVIHHRTTSSDEVKARPVHARRDTFRSSPAASAARMPTMGCKRQQWPVDHGDIITWHTTKINEAPASRTNLQRRCDQSSLLTSSLLPRRVPAGNQQKRHFSWEEHAEAFAEERGRTRAQSARAYRPPVLPDRSVWKIEEQPGYLPPRPPYGVNVDGDEAVAKVSRSYSLTPPFDTS
ncbi:unnamed protein product (mitochondrion) [Plasmodiophora brassicae]|uniref:Uncharacterized protein n=1 Tax=Plasmodiophora brassicae TaxID=37360 RepID=A0A0G4IM43_PLABS|nr:hypothetical protein PBRA_004890 [Plasmodiophora brassicae]SPQ99153.1 unnamed protein product [Plasmodiophora brassicae]